MSEARPTTHSEQERIDSILRKLRERGQRVTAQRVAIIRDFVAHRGHPSAEDIHSELVGQFPMMALSTVYNTLRLLQELGEAVEVSPATTTTRFDPDPDDHCHLTCLACKTIIDLPVQQGATAGLMASAIEALGFEPVRRVDQIFGYCARCRAAGYSAGS